MPDHHMQVFQVGQGRDDAFQGIIAGLDERGTQKQIFCGIATNRQLRRQQQANAALITSARSVDDFLGIARHVAHHIIELGHAEK
jgi:hypothetical protein